MKSTVVYESRYGNTERIAQAVAERLRAAGPVRLLEATDGSTLDIEDGDLLVVGRPTEGHGVSPALRSLLAQVPAGALWGVAAAAFDTRLSWPEVLSGSAARSIAKTLEVKGARLIAPPESFMVTGAGESTLREGELERAGAWAAKIAAADLTPAKALVSSKPALHAVR